MNTERHEAQRQATPCPPHAAYRSPAHLYSLRYNIPTPADHDLHVHFFASTRVSSRFVGLWTTRTTLLTTHPCHMGTSTRSDSMALRLAPLLQTGLRSRNSCAAYTHINSARLTTPILCLPWEGRLPVGQGFPETSLWLYVQGGWHEIARSRKACTRACRRLPRSTTRLRPVGPVTILAFLQRPYFGTGASKRWQRAQW